MRFDPFLSLHDVYVNLAFQKLSDDFHAVMISGDGGSILQDDVLPDSPSLLGYRPDGIAAFENGAFLVEVKSQQDYLSAHSKKQYSVVNQLLMERPLLYYYLLVFGSTGANLIPTEFHESIREKVLLVQE